MESPQRLGPQTRQTSRRSSWPPQCMPGPNQRSVRRWVLAHLVALNQRPSAFVSVCLAVLNRTPKVDRDLGATLQRFFDETMWKPKESKVVAGTLL